MSLLTLCVNVLIGILAQHTKTHFQQVTHIIDLFGVATCVIFM